MGVQASGGDQQLPAAWDEVGMGGMRGIVSVLWTEKGEKRGSTGEDDWMRRIADDAACATGCDDMCTGGADQNKTPSLPPSLRT